MRLILYIDDKSKFQMPVLEPTASAFEVELLTANSVMEGLELLEEYHRAVDAIILDLLFPAGQMQGEEGLKKIKALYPHIPVVVLTDNDSAEHLATAVRCIRSGAFDYVGKSTLNPAHLFHILDNAMQQAALLRKQQPVETNKPEVKDFNVVIEHPNGSYIKYFGFEMTTLIADQGYLKEQVNNAAAWNLRMIKTLSGTYNGILKVRIRLQKEAGSKKISTLIGFAIKCKTEEKLEYYFRLVLDDFINLTRSEKCLYGFTLLEKNEVRLLWNFDTRQEHRKFYRKPVMISTTPSVGFKKENDKQSQEVIQHYLPPVAMILKSDETENLYSTMISSEGNVAITITAHPVSLYLEEIDLLQRVINGKVKLPEQALGYSAVQIIDYYKKIIPESRNGYVISLALSTDNGKPANTLSQSIIDCYFAGAAYASSFPAGNVPPAAYSLQDNSDFGQLAYYYLSNEALNLFRLPLPNSNINRSLPIVNSSNAFIPEGLKDDGILLGVKASFQREKKIYADEESLKRHFYMLGQTGTGKSTMLKTMALDVIRKRNGCCIIDPHGDLFDDIRKLIPSEREDDIIIFDTADLPGSSKLNLLDFEFDKPEQKSTLIQELIKSFNLNYDIKQQGGFMFELFFRAAVLLALDENSKEVLGQPNLHDVKRIVQDRKLRAELLERTKDETVLGALAEVNHMTGDLSWSNFIPYINSKISVFTDNAYVDALFNEKKSTLNFKKVMDEKKILLVRLDKGQVGFNNLNLIGGVFLSKLIMAIMSRSTQPKEKRVPYYVFIDEFHNFLHGDVASALAEVRKYNVSLILANQTLGQLDQQMIDAVLGNVGNTAFFRPGVNDYHKIEHYLSPEFSREEVLKLPNFNCITRLLINNVPSEPFVFQTINN